MKKMKLILLAALTACTLSLSAQNDYKASLFGVRSDGATLNTRSIQKAIDVISEQGGGTLNFYVGRYLTGTIFLKNNVKIVLHEGAILVGVPSVYDYKGVVGGPKALICAENASNIALEGKGVLQGQGAAVMESINVQKEKGYLRESVEAATPNLISMVGCMDVKIDGSLIMQDAAGDVQSYLNCKNVNINGAMMHSRSVANSNGIAFGGCDGFTVTNCYFDVSGAPFKSAGNSKGVKTSGNKTPTGSKPAVTK